MEALLWNPGCGKLAVEALLLDPRVSGRSQAAGLSGFGGQAVLLGALGVSGGCLGAVDSRLWIPPGDL